MIITIKATKCKEIQQKGKQELKQKDQSKTKDTKEGKKRNGKEVEGERNKNGKSKKKSPQSNYINRHQKVLLKHYSETITTKIY